MRESLKPHILRRRVAAEKRPVQQSQASPSERRPVKQSLPVHQAETELQLIGFVVLDRRGRIRHINNVAANMVGFSQTWLLNRPFVVFVAQADVYRFLKSLINSAHESQHHGIQLCLSCDSQQIPVQVVISSIVKQNDVSYQLELLDLTELKKTEI